MGQKQGDGVIDKFSIRTQFMQNNVSGGSISRIILNFADFKKKISLIPMDDEVRNMVLERVNKYPEASLDFVWKKLQDFISAAIRERAINNRATKVPVVDGVVENPVEEVKKQKEKPVKSIVTRPTFNLEEFEKEISDKSSEESV